MAAVNKAIILGNVGKDPEMRQTQSGEPVANFSIATSEKYKDKTGNQVEKTEWHNIVAFGKLAGIISQYVNKGDQLYIEGKITTRKWQDKTGADRWSTEIIANQMQMLGGGQKHTATPGPVVRPEPAAQHEDIPF